MNMFISFICLLSLFTYVISVPFTSVFSQQYSGTCFSFGLFENLLPTSPSWTYVLSMSGTYFLVALVNLLTSEVVPTYSCLHSVLFFGITSNFSTHIPLPSCSQVASSTKCFLFLLVSLHCSDVAWGDLRICLVGYLCLLKWICCCVAIGFLCFCEHGKRWVAFIVIRVA
jgi:hypothetical protein